MFDHLDDPTPFQPDEAFRARVMSRARTLRSRRRRITAATGGALAVGVTTLTLTTASTPHPTGIHVTVTTPTAAPTTVPVPALSQATNILIAGVDPATGANDPGGRTDTLIVARIDPINHSIALLSIPGDLWVPINGHPDRIDNALAAAGPAGLVGVVTNTFSIPINHYLQIDFAGLTRAVDIIGGINLSFAHDVRDLTSGLTLHAGCNHLDGHATLAYLRSRHLETLNPATSRWTQDETSDLGRMQRQRQLLAGLIHQFADNPPDPLTLAHLLDSIATNLTTDRTLTNHDLLALAHAALHTTAVTDYTPSVTNARIAGADVLLPVSDDYDTALTKLFNGETKGDIPPAPPVTTLPAIQADTTNCH